ncbi:MAG: A24 family peptidase C-terminal domain-containing protein [Candidatus Thermoplasmatota archaeon]|nr:A24 family peptidase C-terminal domain-containing protein [Candidatus Thermoplasmatota archaeon]
MPFTDREILDMGRISIAIVLLIIGCRSDWKTRTAEDWVWMVMGLGGIAILASQMLMEGWHPLSFVGLALICVAYADIFIDRKPIYDGETKKIGWLGLAMLKTAIVLLLLLIVLDIPWEQKLPLLAVVTMVYVYYFFYMINIIHGGADAKALMVLSMLFPFYPSLFGLPLIASPPLMQDFFPFSFLILLNAALATLAVPVALLLYNAIKGNMRLPAALFGYKARTDKAPGFYWPMESVEDGKITFSYFPKKGMDAEVQIKALREAGKEEVWVTPKIPFLIPLLAGLLISLLLGNIIHLLV